MKDFNFLQKIFVIFFIGASMCTLQACSDKNDEEDVSYLLGSWYGYSYKREVTITFENDGTGSIDSEWQGSSGYIEIQKGSFTYSVDGNTIKCKGVKTEVDTSGEISKTSFSTTFTYNNGKLTGGYIMI